MKYTFLIILAFHSKYSGKLSVRKRAIRVFGGDNQTQARSPILRSFCKDSANLYSLGLAMNFWLTLLLLFKMHIVL